MDTLPVRPSPAKISPPAPPPSRQNEAFSALYRKHRPFVRRALLGRGVAEANVEDLVQEVFTVVFGRGVFPPDDGQTRAYLWTIAVRIAANHRLLARHSRERSGEELPERGVEPRTVERIDAARWIRRVINRLSPKLRRVIVASEIEGRSIVDIAGELGIPVKTAHARIRLARNEIAKWRWLPT